MTDKEIDDFDFQFDKNRNTNDSSKPDNGPSAPYYKQHQPATAQEKLIAKQLRADQNEYDGKIATLMEMRAADEID